MLLESEHGLVVNVYSANHATTKKEVFLSVIDMLGVGQMESCKNIQLKSLKIEEKWKEKSRKGKKLSHVMLASHVSANSIPGCFLSSSAPHQWA